MFEGLNKHEALIGVGVAIGAALLVLFMKGRSSSSNSGAAQGTNDLMGGFSTASTVFVPTSSYDITYNTNKGTITNNTSGATTVTTYGAGSPVVGAHPIIGSPTPMPIPRPPIITTTGKPKPIPVKPPVKAPAPAPAPKAPTKPAPKPVASVPKHNNHPTSPVVYTAYGTDHYNSSVWGLSDMYVKNHVTHGVAPTNAQIQKEVNSVVKLNHLHDPNKIKKGQKLIMN